MQETPDPKENNPEIDLDEIMIATRQCTACGKEKPYEEFRYVPSRNVYNAQCAPCENLKRRKNYQERKDTVNQRAREWKAENPDKVKASKRRDYVKNKEARLTKSREHRAMNKERYRKLDHDRYVRNRGKILQQFQAYYQKNRAGIRLSRKAYRKNNLQRVRKIARDSRAKNINGKIAESLRKRVRSYLKTGKASTKLLGCEISHLRAWFELNFAMDPDVGMTWKNYGTVWEIDHVRACAGFNMGIQEEINKCFHWTNLAPVDKNHNRQKNRFVSEKDIMRQTVRLNIFEYLGYKQASDTALAQ